MASTDARFGGKIVRPRRKAAFSRTPYDRPSQLPTNSDTRNPNWISRLILSPTRVIASGAGKVLSSVLGSDSTSSSTSSSSDDDIDEMNDDNVTSSHGVSGMDKANPVSEIVREPHFEWKSETKRVIEQLLMQETFSREECERLTHIVQSRVVDSPINEIAEDAWTTELHSLAVTEAKKWLEEKKSGSNSKLNVGHGTCVVNTTMSPPVQSEVGSPVDLAKSYMRARPPWVSPSLNHTQLRSPLSKGRLLANEHSPSLFDGNSTSSKLKRDTVASGSWNILDEIRKVRLKATEDMLRTRPSSRIDWSGLTSDLERTPNLLETNKKGVHMQNLTQPDAPLGVLTHESSVLQVVQDGLQDEAHPSSQATSVPEQRQDSGAMPIVDGPAEDMIAVPGSDGATVSKSLENTNGTCQPLNLAGEGTIKVSHGLVEAETNGFRLLGKMPLNEQFMVSGSSYNETEGASNGEIRNEVSEVNKTDSGVPGSQDSSSTQNDSLSEDPTWPDPKPNTPRKAPMVAEKRQGRRVSSRQNKGTRGRGK